MAEKPNSKGNAAFSSGNFAEAITHFTDAINISPNNHILYSNRSAAYASLSNFTQALTDAQKTVEIKPDWSKGYSRLGAAYFGLKNYSHAVSSYKKGLEIDPDNDALKCGLADADSALLTASLSPRQTELENALKYAESGEETVRLFKEMESCFEESDLVFSCFVVTDKLYREGKDFEQVVYFGKKCLALQVDDYKRTKRGSYIRFAQVLHLLGSACLQLKLWNESLVYLSSADRNLSRIEGKERTSCVVDLELCIQGALCNVKMFLGIRVEAVGHAKRILEIKERILEKGSVELAEAYKDVAVMYDRAYEVKKALPFCLKALEIYKEKLGPDSVEVGEMTRILAVIYHDMKETEKAIELNQAAARVLKKTSPGCLDLSAAEGGNMLIDLGRYEEAVDVMKGLVSREDLRGNARIHALMIMARALCYCGKFADAEEYISEVRRMLEVEKRDSMYVAVLYADMSSLYEKMNDIETAISLLKKGLVLPELPGELLAKFCPQLMSLILSDEEEKIPFIEGVVENLKESFDPKHCAVGYGYTNLGMAYMRSGQTELCAKSLANAKDILDVTLGPHHLTSLKISHALSVAYGMLGRSEQALEIIEKVVGGLKGLEPSELQFMHEVVKHLSNMKERVAESPNMNEDLCAKISQCVISDDGKGT